MASFSKKLDLKYGEYNEETFEEIVKNYEWIIISAERINRTIKKIHSKFQFDIGDINCVAESIEEFKAHAYGVTDFKITNFVVFVDYDDDKQVMCSYMNRFSIMSEDIVLLQDFIKALENTDVDCNEQTEIVNYGTVNSISINGTQNTYVGDNNSDVSISNTIEQKPEEKSDSKVGEFFKNVIYNISSNIIWYILVSVISVIVGCFIASFLKQ